MTAPKSTAVHNMVDMIRCLLRINQSLTNLLVGPLLKQRATDDEEEEIAKTI